MACSSNKLPQYVLTNASTTAAVVAPSARTQLGTVTTTVGSSVSKIPAAAAVEVAAVEGVRIAREGSYQISSSVVVNSALFPPLALRRQQPTTSTTTATKTAAVAARTNSRHAHFECYTMPFARCEGFNNRTSYVPLWNLHVHSKNTEAYKSKPCACNTAVM
jgi:hypothetical protein